MDDLPAGIDGAIARGFGEGGANVLCVLVIMVPRDTQGRGMSAAALRAMGDIARRHGLKSLIAGPAEREGTLSAGADRAVRRLAPPGRPAV